MTSRLAGSLKQTWGSGCLSWQPNDSARFRVRRIFWPLFISSLLVLMQSSFYNLKTHLFWQKHYDITNISIKFNCDGCYHSRTRDVKLSMKRWHDESQTQRNGGSGTGFIECRSIGSCRSSGLCAWLLITGFHFQLLLTLPSSDTKCQ